MWRRRRCSTTDDTDVHGWGCRFLKTHPCNPCHPWLLFSESRPRCISQRSQSESTQKRNGARHVCHQPRLAVRAGRHWKIPRVASSAPALGMPRDVVQKEGGSLVQRTTQPALKWTVRRRQTDSMWPASLPMERLQPALSLPTAFRPRRKLILRSRFLDLVMRILSQIETSANSTAARIAHGAACTK